MTIYISQGRYTAAAIRAMTAKPEDRSEAIAELLAAVGGRLLVWYLLLGGLVWRIVAEAPDERTLVSTVLAAAAGGSLSDITTTVALSAQDTVKAFGQAGELAKKFRSAGADYYGVPVEWAPEIETEPKKRSCVRRLDREAHRITADTIPAPSLRSPSPEVAK